jgi:peptidoglycan-associated lipoprotein
MKISIQATLALLLAISAVSTMTAVAQAPIRPEAAGGQLSRSELAISYNYLRSNAPPGGCACFDLNGGSASFAWPLKTGRFAVVADIAAAHASAISSPGYDLTLSTYTVGGRYRQRQGHSQLQPFGQVLIGLAHSSGSLVVGANSATSNAGAAFAAKLGGGLDLGLNRLFSWRLIEADYLVTTFDNGVNDRQNNLRIGAGVVVHFGK